MSNSGIALKSSLRLENHIYAQSFCFLFTEENLDLYQGNKWEFGLL